MKRFFSLFLVFFSTFVAAQPTATCDPDAQAQYDNAAPRRLDDLIGRKQFGAIQAELDGELKRYENGESSDMQIYAHLIDFVGEDRTIGFLLTQWVDADPKAFFARQIKGMHHIEMGFAKRGTKTAEKISAEQFSAMDVEFKNAVIELQAAQKIRPTSTLPLAALMLVAKAVSGIETVRGLLAEAKKRDSRTVAARYEAILALSPKWGGSFEAMDSVVDQARLAGVSTPRVRYLQYETEMQKARYLHAFFEDKAEAISHYRKAAQLCQALQPWSAISNAATTMKDWNTVREATTQVLSMNSKSSKDFQRRGWANERLGHMDAALQDYQAAADLGDIWAMKRLGDMYMFGSGAAKDLHRAKTFLEAAAAKGDANSRSLLVWVNQELGKKEK